MAPVKQLYYLNLPGESTMPFKDIDIFLQAVAAILQGYDPYAIPDLEVFYPLPFYFLFIPLVGVPVPAVYGLWTALSIIILVAILRQRAPIAALSMPVLLTLLLGQVDLVMMALFSALRSSVVAGIALAFLVLKPQLVLLIAPWLLWRWWRNDRRQILWFTLVIGVIIALSFIIQPDWLWRFFARSGERTRASISSSIWGLFAFLPSSLWLPITALVVALIVIWVWRQDNFNLIAATNFLVSPFIFSYNLTPLFVVIRRPSILIGLTALSWITFTIAAWQSNDRADAFITLAILVVLLVEKRRIRKSSSEAR
jgi:hypothetical protein